MTNKQIAASLHVKGEKGEWWVHGFDEPMGPYATKQEAEEDRRGVALFYRNIDDRSFFTSD